MELFFDEEMEADWIERKLARDETVSAVMNKKNLVERWVRDFMEYPNRPNKYDIDIITLSEIAAANHYNLSFEELEEVINDDANSPHSKLVQWIHRSVFDRLCDEAESKKVKKKGFGNVYGQRRFI